MTDAEGLARRVSEAALSDLESQGLTLRSLKRRRSRAQEQALAASAATITARLRHRMDAQGYTVDDLAALLSVSPREARRYLAGTRSMRLDHFFAVVCWLDDIPADPVDHDRLMEALQWWWQDV